VAQESAAERAIEIYHQDVLNSGSRICEGLSAAVDKSIKSLTNGFLKHSANESLRSARTRLAAVSSSLSMAELTVIVRTPRRRLITIG